MLIVFDDMIADLEANKKLSAIVSELFLEEQNAIFHLFLYHNLISKFLKLLRLNAIHCFIMKILKKREFQQIALNHSSDIDLKDFMKLYKEDTKEPFSFLVNDTTLSSDNLLRFRKNLL